MRSFKHSGDAGDIIYALPAMRAAGGGQLYLSKSDYTRVPTSLETLRNLAPLLESQYYVSSVELYNGGAVAFDLDGFRWTGKHERNIAERTLLACGLPVTEMDQSWLEVTPWPAAAVVVNRTARYQNHNFPWREVRAKYRHDMTFVGTKDEHDAFCRAFGRVPYLETKTLLDLAQVIGGCDIFIGNQSSAYAIAEGLKMPVIQEVSLTIPNCMFNRSDAQYVAGNGITLPDL